MTIKCLDCDNYARWHVWYKGSSAYNSFCDEHATYELFNGRDGWQVECIKLVDNQFLPAGDRAADLSPNSDEFINAPPRPKPNTL